MIFPPAPLFAGLPVCPSLVEPLLPGGVAFNRGNLGHLEELEGRPSQQMVLFMAGIYAGRPDFVLDAVLDYLGLRRLDAGNHWGAPLQRGLILFAHRIRSVLHVDCM